MVQNIQPPHDSYRAQSQPASDTQSIRGKDIAVGAGSGTPVSAPEPTREQAEQAAARVKEVLRGTTSQLEFEIDPDLDKVVIKIRNGESGEIIRQIPAQELLDLAKHLEEPKGLLVSERA